MDAQQTRENFLHLLRQVANKKARDDFRSEFQELMRHVEDPAVTTDNKAIYEARILQLCRSVEVASHVKFWSPATAWFATFIALLFFISIFLYMRGLNEPISSVKATRPILVFTLIVAMLGFGGLLIVRSLFAAEEDEQIEKRFRLAREIFLVYAGIFGTIIGFYFGAADDKVYEPPSLSVGVDRRTLTAEVTGGDPPFTAFASREGPPLDLLLQGEDRLFSTDLTVCPIEATVTVIDGAGRRASADIREENITNWEDCANKRTPEFMAPAPAATGEGNAPGAAP